MKNKHASRYQMLGQRIKKERKKFGITQVQLAERIGISNSYITKIEATNCDKSFSLEVIFDICDTLGISVESLFKNLDKGDFINEKQFLEENI